MALPTARELAATYNPPSYPEPWDCVEDYQRVLEYTGAHPNKGSCAVSSALDLPRSRIRPWMNGSRPDVVRGIQTAEARGWTAEHASSDEERGLVELAAWVLSGGTLHVGDSPHVYFSLDADQGHFEHVADAGNISYRVIRSDDPDRPAEARPSEDGAVLARVLAAMGVPEGGKSASTPQEFPGFVANLDRELRAAFVGVYVLNRGAESEEKATLQIREERTPQYLDGLVSLLRDVSGERVVRSGKTVTVSAAAARKLPV